jgi:hypothetical protein
MAENLRVQAFMPDGTPAPYVLTPELAVIFLQFDGEVKNPENTLKYYREKRMLKGTYYGKRCRYSLKELCDFVDRQTKENRRTKT